MNNLLKVRFNITDDKFSTYTCTVSAFFHGCIMKCRTSLTFLMDQGPGLTICKWLVNDKSNNLKVLEIISLGFFLLAVKTQPLFIYFIFFIFFSYNCLHFLPIPPTHHSQIISEYKLSNASFFHMSSKGINGHVLCWS